MCACLSVKVDTSEGCDAAVIAVASFKWYMFEDCGELLCASLQW